MAKEPKKLDDLFHDTLKDIYYAEKKILTALPKMAKAAQSEELRAAFEKHRGETEDQVERLEQVFELIGKKAQGKTCDAIVGIVEEGQEIIKDYEDRRARRRPLGRAQAVEHYEISLRHAHGLGQRAGPGRRGSAARGNAGRGEKNRRGVVEARPRPSSIEEAQ